MPIGAAKGADHELVDHQSKEKQASRRGLCRLKPELAALREADLLRVNVDADKTAKKVLGLLPGIRALGGDLRKALPTFDQSLFDKLEDGALALAAAQAQYLAADPDNGASRVLQQAVRLRRVLMADAKALCARGFLKPSQLNRVRGLRGYENTARDLGTLSALLRRALPNIQGKSAVTVSELDQAAKVALQLRLAHEGREQPNSTVTADDRTRVFTLLSQTYASVRRTINYLRANEGDADVLMPPLCGRRPRKRGVAR